LIVAEADHERQMGRTRRASIEWSAEHVRHGLPAIAETTDPAWFIGDAPSAHGWSLVCRFEWPPSAQGNPSIAVVAFLVAHAPHERLRPGVESL
jgi:hypothetical protein